MEQTNFNPGQNPQKSKATGKLIVTVVITALVVGGAAYFFEHSRVEEVNQDLKKEIQDLQDEVNRLKQSELAARGVQAQFEQAINAKEYDSTEELFTDPVEVIIEATECCGPVSPAEAAQHMDYMEQAGEFNFDQDQQIVRKMKVNLADYFANDIIGVSPAPENAILSYRVNAQDKIERVYMAVTVDLLDIE